MHLPRRIAAIVVALGAAASACSSAPPQPEAVRTVIVHASRALPDRLPASLDELRGVQWTRLATSAMVNLVRVEAATPLPPRAPGTVLPFSIGAAEPLPDPADAISALLAAGKAVVPTSSARVRGIIVGSAITIGLEDRRQRLVVGAITDEARTVEVEALIPLDAARRLGVTGVRQIVAGVAESKSQRFADVARELSAPVPVRVGSAEDVETPDAGKLLSLSQIKERFGEFSFVPGEGRWLEPDPAWQAANIEERHVPVLGTIKCHRAIMDPLIAAMRDIEAAGLDVLITEKAFCYAPRVQFGDTRVISRHTWGIAVDINPTTNAFGDPPTQDARLVRIMSNHGFAWGGVWLTPDGMHFEYTGGTA